MIISSQAPTSAEIAAALASGYALELRRGEPARFIDSGEHIIELDALGDRLSDVLPCESRPVVRPEQPDLLPTPFATLSGYLTEVE